MGTMKQATVTKHDKPKRLWWRRAPRWLGLAMLIYFMPVFVGCMNISTPFDYVINMGSFPHHRELLVPADGKRHVVFLKHGIFRSAAALWKMERALRDHGYEVHNISYDSTNAYIEDFSAQLAKDSISLAMFRPRLIVGVPTSSRACIPRVAIQTSEAKVA